MKNKKISLLHRTMVLLVTAMLCAITVIAVLRAVNIVREEDAHVSTVTSQAAAQVNILFNESTLSSCLTEPDSPETAEMRRTLRSLCTIEGLEYLYVYIPDFNNGTVTYVLAAAADDELDEALTKTRITGTVTSLEPDILQANINAWNGFGDNRTRYTNQYGNVSSSFYPLTDKGKNIAIVGADFDFKALVEDSLKDLMLKMIVSSVGTLILFVIIGIVAKKKVVSPILQVSNEMLNFTSNIHSKEFVPVNISTGDEIQTMAESFNTMAKELLSLVDKEKEFAAARAKVETELSVARQIQESIVAPRSDIKLSDGLQISSRMICARQVGGDFYDHFELPDGRYCVVIGDVSGKGVGAAMFMMMVKAVLHEKLLTCKAPEQALYSANNVICKNNSENMFATVFVAEIDANRAGMQYVNAGHNPPIIVGKNGIKSLNGECGVVLGIFEDSDYISESSELLSGDAVLLFTDGVTDCVNENNEFFGENGLNKALSKLRNVSASQLCDFLTDTLEEHRGKAEQFDDITAVCFTRDQAQANDPI